MRKKINLTIFLGLSFLLIACSRSVSEKKVEVFCKDVLRSLGYVFTRNQESHESSHPIGKGLRRESDVLGLRDYEDIDSKYFLPTEYLMSHKVTVYDNEGIYECESKINSRGNFFEFLICGKYVLSSNWNREGIRFPQDWRDEISQGFGKSRIENIYIKNQQYTPLPVNNGMVLPYREHNNFEELRPKIKKEFPIELGKDCFDGEGFKYTGWVKYKYGHWCRKTEACSIGTGSITSFSFNTLLIPIKYKGFFNDLTSSEAYRSGYGDPITGIHRDCFYDEVDPTLKKKCLQKKDQLSSLLNREDIIPITIKITTQAAIEKDLINEI